jgi:hypothetical protein
VDREVHATADREVGVTTFGSGEKYGLAGWLDLCRVRERWMRVEFILSAVLSQKEAE